MYTGSKVFLLQVEEFSNVSLIAVCFDYHTLCVYLTGAKYSDTTMQKMEREKKCLLISTYVLYEMKHRKEFEMSPWFTDAVNMLCSSLSNGVTADEVGNSWTVVDDHHMGTKCCTFGTVVGTKAEVLQC